MCSNRWGVSVISRKNAHARIEKQTKFIYLDEVIKYFESQLDIMT